MALGGGASAPRRLPPCPTARPCHGCVPALARASLNPSSQSADTSRASARCATRSADTPCRPRSTRQMTWYGNPPARSARSFCVSPASSRAVLIRRPNNLLLYATRYLLTQIYRFPAYRASHGAMTSAAMPHNLLIMLAQKIFALAYVFPLTQYQLIAIFIPDTESSCLAQGQQRSLRPPSPASDGGSERGEA